MKLRIFVSALLMMVLSAGFSAPADAGPQRGPRGHFSHRAAFRAGVPGPHVIIGGGYYGGYPYPYYDPYYGGYPYPYGYGPGVYIGPGWGGYGRGYGGGGFRGGGFRGGGFRGGGGGFGHGGGGHGGGHGR